MYVKNNSFKFLILIVAFLFTTGVTQAADSKISSRPAVKQFIDDMVKKHNFDKAALNTLFDQAHIKAKIISAISRPAEAKPWYKYRPIFVTQKRIKKGVEFWNKHRADLERAEKVYGVPPEIITAIIGVETFYGKHTGGYRVIDSLSTLAFGYPKRSKFFTSELEHFLLMAREEKMDPLTLMGSYAGAMGQPQFISSSFRSYAVDFDNDGKRDLWNNTTDAIGSVGNYFKRHGWKKGEPVAHKATITGSQYKALAAKGLKPRTSVKEFRNKGVSTAHDLQKNQKASLITLDQKNGQDYWLGLNNFYVITRYNHSPLYAMAVYQLGQKIREVR